MMTTTNATGGLSMGAALGELFTGKAFKPHPLDFTRGLHARVGDAPVFILVLARDRAALMRVVFSDKRVLLCGEARQLLWRQPADLSSALRLEVEKHPSVRYLLGVLTTGWSAQYSMKTLRSAELEVGVPGALRLREESGDFVQRPNPDLVYGGVDHTSLERCLVFGIRHSDTKVLSDVAAKAGLSLLGVRVGMASLVEAWFSRGGDGFQEDILFCDGLGLLLLGASEGDLVPPPPGPDGSEVPRQVSSRPNDIPADMQRLLSDFRGHRLRYVGTSDCFQVLQDLAARQDIEIVRDELLGEVDQGLLAADKAVFNDYSSDLAARRRPLSTRHRKTLFACAAGLALGLFGFSATLFRASQLEDELRTSNQRISGLAMEISKAEMDVQALQKQITRACRIRQWLETHPRSQHVVNRFLRVLPESVALERVAMQVDDGGRQMSLEFCLRGGSEALSSAVRSIETDLVSQGYRIGDRLPLVQVPQGVSYRWRLLMPGSQEVALQ